MEDEIDLRKYLDVLLRHWKLIVSISVIAAIVAGLVSFLLPPTYEAKAAVLVTTARPEITLEPKYKTSLVQDKVSLRKTLIALVKSSTVANQVVEQLGDKLKPEERRVENMLDKVQVTERGDLIEITVESTDPQKAAAIASAWVESYESYVNDLYRGVYQSQAELQAQADAARKEYEEEQKAWADFIRDNRIVELSQQIADMELLCDVKSLREQIKAGSSSSASAAANSLAIILLQTKAYASLPTGLQISLDRLSGLNVSLDDIDALISTLEARAAVTPEQSIGELRQRIHQLEAELEQENAERRELEKSRDIVWQAYTTVTGKVVEVKVAARAQSDLVQVAVVAVVPESPVAPRRAMNIGVALVLGLVVGIFSAFGVEYFKKTAKKPEEEKNEE